LTGGASVNRFTITNWTGAVTLDGAAGNDEVVLTLNGGTITTVDPLLVAADITSHAAATSATVNGSLTLNTIRTVNVADGSAASDVIINAAITGSGGLTKQGAGTLVLAGTNSYNGTTTVAAGTLLVSGTSSATPIALNGGTL